jgi:hypothetical protein
LLTAPSCEAHLRKDRTELIAAPLNPRMPRQAEGVRARHVRGGEATRPKGIVAKRKADPYSPEVNWLKIKNPAYTQGEGRWELFQKRS